MGRDGDIYAARSLQDGTLIQPVDESSWEEERGIVRVHWHGDCGRESMIDGSDIATIALERSVRLHGVGALEEDILEEDIATELWFLADHFYKKTSGYQYSRGRTLLNRFPPRFRCPQSASVLLQIGGLIRLKAGELLASHQTRWQQKTLSELAVWL